MSYIQRSIKTNVGIEFLNQWKQAAGWMTEIEEAISQNQAEAPYEKRIIIIISS